MEENIPGHAASARPPSSGWPSPLFPWRAPTRLRRGAGRRSAARRRAARARTAPARRAAPPAPPPTPPVATKGRSPTSNA